MLLEKLIQKQGKMSDSEFARLLGVPRSTWQLTRTGRQVLGRRVAKAAQKAFPDLAPDVVYFLLSDASGHTRTASEPTNELEVVA